VQSLDEVRTVRLMGLNMDGPAAYLWALGGLRLASLSTAFATPNALRSSGRAPRYIA
jgi:hypothetical protein